MAEFFVNVGSIPQGAVIKVSVNVVPKPTPTPVPTPSPTPVPSGQTRYLDFSGYRWLVRSGYGGPGPNNWSNSFRNVWVDELGQLHLKLTNVGGKWYCSEVSSLTSFGYGEYIFYVANRVDMLDHNVVGGLFTYLNDENEIDIEFSRWGIPNAMNADYAVQQPPGMKQEGRTYLILNIPLRGDYSTHRFIWKPDGIYFRSDHGHYQTPRPDTLIHEWTYQGTWIPRAATEKLLMNLWLNNGVPPTTTGKDNIEMVIKRFEFRKL